MEAEKLHAAMSRHVEAGALPGVVTALARGEDVVIDALGHHGFAADSPPMRHDTIFRIASLTKPVTATAVLLLVQDGVVRLDDPVDELLPELAARRVLAAPDGPLTDTVAADRPITVRDLLTFTWGLGMDVELPPTAPIQQAIAELELGVGPPTPLVPHDPDEWLRRVGSLPLMRQPGEKWIYHVGSDVLGVLVARAAGTGLASFLRSRIFVPLGMVDTDFSVPAGERPRLPPLYGDDRAVADPRDGGWSTPPAFPSGAGGLVSTAADYLAFTQVLGGGLLTPASVALMTTDQLTPDQKGSVFLGDRGWGLGMSVYDDRVGWAGGTGTSWFSEPRRGTTALLLTQQMFGPASGPLVAEFEQTATAALRSR